MNTKVYVDNLAATTTETELVELFSPFGNVANANIAVDRSNQKPRGFGFVTMITPEGAQAAIEALNGKMLGTSTLTVSEAWPDEDRPGSMNGRPSPRRQPSHLF
jgi:RNA recognition motif-containing protein